MVTALSKIKVIYYIIFTIPMEKRYCNTKKKLNQNKITEIVLMKSATIEKSVYLFTKYSFGVQLLNDRDQNVRLHE